MLKKQEILNGLNQCHCSENYWKNGLLTFQYTDGIKFLHESADCYWLLIAISSYKRNEPFQVWELKVNENHSAILTMIEDTGEPELVKQNIPNKDIPPYGKT